MASRKQRKHLVVIEKKTGRLGQVKKSGKFNNAFVLFEDAEIDANVRKCSLLPVDDILKSIETLQKQMAEHIERIKKLEQQLKTKIDELTAENTELRAENEKQKKSNTQNDCRCDQGNSRGGSGNVHTNTHTLARAQAAQTCDIIDFDDSESEKFQKNFLSLDLKKVKATFSEGAEKNVRSEDLRRFYYHCWQKGFVTLEDLADAFGWSHLRPRHPAFFYRKFCFFVCLLVHRPSNLKRRT